MQLNVDDSISTLKSLSNLLGQMGNIAINAAVGRNIYEAVDAIKDAKSSFTAKKLRDALAHSRRAWEKSGADTQQGQSQANTQISELILSVLNVWKTLKDNLNFYI